MNAVVSKIAFAIAVPEADASSHRLGREFDLAEAPTAPATHRGARLVLLNTAWGLSTPRSLPPKLKASWGLPCSHSGCLTTALQPTNQVALPCPALPCTLQMVGPLLVRADPRPLPPALQHIISQAGDRGVVVARCGL